MGTEVQPMESSSEPDLKAIVSDLAAEIWGFKGQIMVLLEDIAARSDSSLACNAVKDYSCNNCGNSQGVGDEHGLESLDRW